MRTRRNSEGAEVEQSLAEELVRAIPFNQRHENFTTETRRPRRKAGMRLKPKRFEQSLRHFSVL
jgi:hypothetical protein